jgi:hypothetical protein
VFAVSVKGRMKAHVGGNGGQRGEQGNVDDDGHDPGDGEGSNSAQPQPVSGDSNGGGGAGARDAGECSSIWDILGRVASVVGIMDLFDGWMMGLELNESREVLLNTYGIEVTRIEERDNGSGRTWLQNTSRSYYTVHTELDLWRYMPYSRVASRYVNPCLLCREMSF